MPDDALCLPYGPATTGSPAKGTAVTLYDLPLGEIAHVHSVDLAGDSEGRDLALRLLEIGFVPGERVRVIAHGHPGHEPVAVRIGGTTFALRRFEAERVLVHTKHAGSAA